jgi:hypothetical protein
VVALATVDCAEVPSNGIRRSGSSFVQLVFESAGRPVRLRAASRWGIAMTALFDPTMRAVKEQLYQSERPWVVDSSKFEQAFGSVRSRCSKPSRRRSPGFEITSGVDGIDIQLRAHGHRDSKSRICGWQSSEGAL